MVAVVEVVAGELLRRPRLSCNSRFQAGSGGFCFFFFFFFFGDGFLVSVVLFAELSSVLVVGLEVEVVVELDAVLLVLMALMV